MIGRQSLVNNRKQESRERQSVVYGAGGIFSIQTSRHVRDRRGFLSAFVPGGKLFDQWRAGSLPVFDDRTATTDGLHLAEVVGAGPA